MKNRKTALITGADSGIGFELACSLAKRGYDLILVARNRQKLDAAKQKLKKYSVSVRVLPADLSRREECLRVYEETKPEQIAFAANNAGVGVYGSFAETDLEKELNLIDVNITAVHMLTKLFLRDMRKRGSGVILNVASSAGFMAGPYFSSYYASKNYVVRLTQAIREELRREGSKVKIAALCPGPVKTSFDENAGVRRSMQGMDPRIAAEYGVSEALRGRCLIVPGVGMKLGLLGSKLLGEGLLTRVTGTIQKRKGGRNGS
ncbi:MAG: SDR family oxidoreductase [Lachnospiraceae bacterium]|nr:SDR family oxidoreductase [Lachnospiraceae bacterium]